MPPENTFDHLRKLDGEHVGYIHMTDDGGFVPFDLLHRRRSAATDLESAESLLDDLGLRMFMDEWWLSVDGQHQQVLIQEVRRDRVLVAPTVAGANSQVCGHDEDDRGPAADRPAVSGTESSGG